MTIDVQIVAAAVGSWKQIVARLDKGLSAASEEDLQKEVAPGRNRVFYLIGHLTAVHDRLFSLLNLGERLYPGFDKIFIESPDSKSSGGVSTEELRKAWTDVNTKLTAAIESLQPAQWLEKHAAVSDEDFSKDPSRNRLAVLLSRTNHASFHQGQIRLTQPS